MTLCQSQVIFQGLFGARERNLRLDAGLLEGLASGGLLSDLAPLDEAAGEGPLAVAGLYGTLDQDHVAVKLEDCASYQLRPQIEYEAATLAHEPLRISAFEQADGEAVATPGAELVLGGPLLYFHSILRLLQRRAQGSSFEHVEP